MKPQIENITSDSVLLFGVNHAFLPFLDSPWHFQLDYEVYLSAEDGKGIFYKNFFDIILGHSVKVLFTNCPENFNAKKDLNIYSLINSYK